MADKTPVRVVFNSSSVATGLAEYQSGETVPVANGVKRPATAAAEPPDEPPGTIFLFQGFLTGP